MPRFRWIHAAGRALLAATLGSLVVLAAAGCGSENEPRPFSELINVRNGTWITSRTVTTSGPDSCNVRAQATVIDTTGVCFVNPAGGGTFLGFLCTVDQPRNSEAVSYECTATLDLGPCLQTWTITGTGTVTDTTFELFGTMYASVSGDSLQCLQFVDPCTSMVTLTGVYFSDAGEDSCDRIEAFLPLSDTVGWILAPSIPAP